MIKPTVGRVVLYRPQVGGGDGHMAVNDPETPFSASITYVWNDGCVNLSIFDHDGMQYGKTSVPLAQDRDALPGECEWMDYQKGQAAKTEELEAELTG